MYLESGNREECYACGACHAACPVQAIGIREGEDTFLYPAIDADKCIHCHLCERVCPHGCASGAMPLFSEAAVTKSPEDDFKSSSGGAFKCVVKACIDANRGKYSKFHLCACEWTGHLQARHTVSEYTGEETIDRYSKSKYVQSYTWGMHAEIKKVLQKPENFLIFCGTPCQVAGLKAFLRKPFPNLFTIDIICHGVPSQRTFQKYIRDCEEREGAQVQSYEFRNKRILPNGTKYVRSSAISYANGKENLVTRFNDDYVNIFYTKSYHYRPSCYPCRFKAPHRVSDITLGDAWHLEELYPEINPMHGVSCIIYNTQAGLALQGAVERQMNIFPCSTDFLVAHNKPLREPEGNSCPPHILKAFFAGIKSDEKSFSKCVSEYISAIENLNK